MSASGVLQVHCAPPALCPHIEWAVAGVLGVPVSLPWVDQPASPGALRAELEWQGHPGASGAITSALAGWNRLRFEVTEDASPGCDAVRYSYTPALGTFSGVVAANGDILVPEGRLRAAMALAASSRAGSGQPVTARPTPALRPGRPTTAGAASSARCATRTSRATRRSAGRWRRNCRCCSASPGTTSSSRSGTPGPGRRSAGSTPPGDPRRSSLKSI